MWINGSLQWTRSGGCIPGYICVQATTLDEPRCVTHPVPAISCGRWGCSKEQLDALSEMSSSADPTTMETVSSSATPDAASTSSA